MPRLTKAQRSQQVELADAITAAFSIGTTVPIGDWWEEPMPLPQFAAEVLGFPLWPAQEEDLGVFLGTTSEDAKRLFTQNPPSPYNCGILAWGKGSGKDSSASVAIAWFAYVCLCMNDPQQFLGLGEDEPIDIALASPTLRQTRRVTFTKVKARLRRAKWFEKRLASLGISNPARYLKKATDAADFIELPNTIRVHNLPLSSTSAEGFNLLAFVISELAGLESEADASSAADLFNTFVSSGRTRYNRGWKGFIASYPRSINDPQEQLIADQEAGLFPELFVVRRPTWEVHPRLKRADFDTDFARNPEDSAAKYGARPRAATEGFFRSPELIVRNASGGSIELFRREYRDVDDEQLQYLCDRFPDPVVEHNQFDDVMLNKYGFPQLYPWFKGQFGCEYFAHIDVGLTRDSAGFCLGHLHPDPNQPGVVSIVVDLAMRWRASHFTDFGEVQRFDWQGTGTYTETLQAAEVDLKTITDFVIWLRNARGFDLNLVTTDGYNSAQLRQTLYQNDVPCINHVTDKTDYDELKGRIYERELLFRCDRILNHELTKLIVVRGKVEAPRTNTGGGKGTDSHKDGADAVAAVVGRLARLATSSFEVGQVDAPEDQWDRLKREKDGYVALDRDQASEVQKAIMDEFLSGDNMLLY